MLIVTSIINSDRNLAEDQHTVLMWRGKPYERNEAPAEIGVIHELRTIGDMPYNHVSMIDIEGAESDVAIWCTIVVLIEQTAWWV